MHILRPESMKNGFAANKNERKLLDAPVSMGSLVASNNQVDETQSIWIQKNDDALRTVDSKKLEKAEQQLAKKAEKAEKSETKPTNKYKSNEASASQILSSKMTSGAALLSKDIKLEGFDISFGEKVLLKNSDLSLTFGRRYGMVGRNGLGKLHCGKIRNLLSLKNIS